MKIDVVIPVLNEEQTLERNTRKVLEFLAAQGGGAWDVRIVLADNGSTDRTGELGEKLAADHDNVAYLRVPETGVGSALKAAWGQSDADIVGYIDLDLATDLKHLPEAFAAITSQGADIVFGTRLHKDSRVLNRTLKRTVVSRIFNFAVRRVLGVSLSDGMCGFKFLRRPILERLLDGGAVSDGWFFCTEILVVAEWLGLKARELPVHWTDDPNSRVRLGKLTCEYLRAMHNLRKRRPRHGA